MSAERRGRARLFERPSSASDILARQDTVAIALDGVQDPGNVGTIVRLAAAFDAAGVLLLPGCADPFGESHPLLGRRDSDCPGCADRHPS
jgi:tRNA G18 (ribose-2'-O)-methylase SpoU